jgi:hypothetical protein
MVEKVNKIVLRLYTTCYSQVITTTLQKLLLEASTRSKQIFIDIRGAFCFSPVSNCGHFVSEANTIGTTLTMFFPLCISVSLSLSSPHPASLSQSVCLSLTLSLTVSLSLTISLSVSLTLPLLVLVNQSVCLRN